MRENKKFRNVMKVLKCSGRSRGSRIPKAHEVKNAANIPEHLEQELSPPLSTTQHSLG
jgi:hypothetical protein